MRRQDQGSRGHTITFPTQSLKTSRDVCPLTAARAFSTVYTTGGLLVLFASLYSGFIGRNWWTIPHALAGWFLQMHSISFFQLPFWDIANVYPISQIPLFNLVIPSIVEGSKLSVSVKPFPDTLALWPSLSLTYRP